MNHVVTLSDSYREEPNESYIVWNGKNKLGNDVVNGTYFCRLSIENNIWTLNE